MQITKKCLNAPSGYDLLANGNPFLNLGNGLGSNKKDTDFIPCSRVFIYSRSKDGTQDANPL